MIHALMRLSTLLLLFPDHFSCCGKGKFIYQTKSLTSEIYTDEENCVLEGVVKEGFTEEKRSKLGFEMLMEM